MNGTVNVYIPLRADGERMTGEVPKGMRTRATFIRSVDARPFFDPEATRNPSNAIPLTDTRHPLHPRNLAKRGPVVMVAPRGWSLKPRPVVEVVEVVVPEVEVPGEHCGKSFRTPGGYVWHLANIHPQVAA